MNSPSNVLTAAPDDLRFWLQPPGSAPYEVDLTEFALGGTADSVPSRSRSVWAGDFRGRPAFAREIGAWFRATLPPEADLKSCKYAWRTLMRFLDEIDAPGMVASCGQLDDGHGALLQRWCEAKGYGASAYRLVKRHVDIVREHAGEPMLFWPARARDKLGYREDIDEVAIRRLYTAFKKEAMSVKGNFREGELLASQGQDPRGARSQPGSANWERRENHAWLVRELTRERLPYKQAFYDEGARGLNTPNYDRQAHLGPDYLAPGMTDRAREGIVGKLRWFHPSYHDTGLFLWLFMLGTGWNLATVLALDVSEDGEWFEPHPLKAEFRIVHAFKGRSDRHVFVPSLAKPEWHPFQIVRFMLERTAVLRKTVRYRLKEAMAEQELYPSPAVLRRIASLSEMLKSPWLYHVVNKVGEIGCMGSSDSAQLNNLARAAAERHGLLASHPELGEMTTSVARDAWIGHAYQASGYNVLLARLAAQHADARSLRHYLRQRRYRTHSEAAVRSVQDAAFEEIAAGRVLDPARLRLLVEHGKITPQQERRLLDRRQRTRLGMGCLDPTHPPRHVAPDHVEGKLCRVQRCTGCPHGIIFDDSLEPLARARAELIHLKRSLPLTAWIGTSFEDEERSLEMTLRAFDQSQVDAVVGRWTQAFLSGEEVPHDSYPSY